MAREWHDRRGEARGLLWVRSYRQATLEVDVAELVDPPSLAKHAPFSVRIGEKAHQPPWEVTLHRLPTAGDQESYPRC